jgi:hypothetical protein
LIELRDGSEKDGIFRKLFFVGEGLSEQMLESMFMDLFFAQLSIETGKIVERQCKFHFLDNHSIASNGTRKLADVKRDTTKDCIPINDIAEKDVFTLDKLGFGDFSDENLHCSSPLLVKLCSISTNLFCNREAGVWLGL